MCQMIRQELPETKIVKESLQPNLTVMFLIARGSALTDIFFAARTAPWTSPASSELN